MTPDFKFPLTTKAPRETSKPWKKLTKAERRAIVKQQVQDKREALKKEMQEKEEMAYVILRKPCVGSYGFNFKGHG